MAHSGHPRRQEAEARPNPLEQRRDCPPKSLQGLGAAWPQLEPATLSGRGVGTEMPRPCGCGNSIALTIAAQRLGLERPVAEPRMGAVRISGAGTCDPSAGGVKHLRRQIQASNEGTFSTHHPEIDLAIHSSPGARRRAAAGLRDEENPLGEGGGSLHDWGIDAAQSTHLERSV